MNAYADKYGEVATVDNVRAWAADKLADLNTDDNFTEDFRLNMDEVVNAIDKDNTAVCNVVNGIYNALNDL